MNLSCAADCHTHSKYSFDGKENISDMCEAAVKRGLSVLTVTDHCDIDDIIEGKYPEYDAESYIADIEKEKTAFSDKLILLKGIELGQAIYYPDKAKELIGKYKYDFVIGSMHNLRQSPDFSQYKWKDMTDSQIEYYFRRSLEEIYRITEFEGVNTIAHINYPVRYIRRAGKELKYDAFLREIGDIYRKIIEKKISLECNTSGWHKQPVPDDINKRTLPDTELLQMYYDLGGRMITIGSDAHAKDFIGTGINESLSVLKKIGFEYITVYINGQPVSTPINICGE